MRITKRSCRGIIFDMDGVLVNTEPHHLIIEKGLFSELGLPIDDEEHKEYLGKSALRMWSEIKERYNPAFTPEELAEKNILEIHRYFSSFSGDLSMPGIVKMLTGLSSQGIPLALASGSDTVTIEILLQKTGIRGFFSHVVSSDLIGKSKPDPAIFTYTLGLLGITAAECIVVEDSPNGIKAAKAAGIFCVAYRGVNGHAGDLNEADIIISDFEKIQELIK